MINFSTWDVIVVLLMGVLVFLGPVALFLWGIRLIRRGQKGIGYAFVVLPIGYYLIPNVIAGVQYLTMRSYTLSQWAVPETPLTVEGRSVLCISESEGVPSVCKNLLEYRAPSEMIHVQVSDDVDDTGDLETTYQRVERLTVETKMFYEHEITNVVQTPIELKVKPEQFDVVIREFWPHRKAERKERMPRNLHVRFVQVFDKTQKAGPVAQFADGQAQLNYGIVWMFGDYVYFPDGDEMNLRRNRFICGDDANPYCSGY
ncbi:hypothetical protein CEW89_06080 [Celeribacter ethanolicus]|uniref:Uncharacterized protein n=1 Tax=Celeribacter ethanolicus TaxID=1758178 RepID=A0A291GAT5_9RHOB|nr:hypothetical protein [Celeribacter ethanolicus]ATG47174.1 hypothetical protein CEW89_06080 [Celeribacter ethanolicus]